ncbi:DUF3152 domain-containing protein [Actinoplanes sp. M2I2]|uniref:DUF3152 domain-containing protein n=1 Tax=Actinoplanes sp. M2I2 TaxID=1734444 RepID=UPI0020207E7C|nr:DUF3152 domain-containing protein [Actinoplanes sp. M2I2]
MRKHSWAAALIAVGTLAACDTTATGPPPVAPVTTPASVPARASAPSPSPPRPKPIAFPLQGPAKWRYAPAGSATAGRGGTLLRYRVAVEQGITGVSPEGFAAAADAALADPRGWIRGHRWRFRRAGPGQPHDFTLYLATPVTRDRLCDDVPEGYTSCRNGDRVVLNVARWAGGVPFYRGKLTTYRQYMVNHEVGHRLGHGHERCPGPGEPAPVMQQQTLGLHGCTVNPWPYPDGTLYRGPSGQYDDQPPSQMPSSLNR